MIREREIEFQNDIIFVVNIILLTCQTQKRRYSKKKFWVAPLFRNHDEYGFYKATLPYIKLESKRFRNYFRMSSTQLEDLLQIVEPKLHKQTFIREPVSAEERLCLTLRYLASGDSMVSLSYHYLLGCTTISNIISETCEVIWNILCSVSLPSSLTKEDWLHIAADFENECNFPHCIGAIDGKHIVIQSQLSAYQTIRIVLGNQTCDLDSAVCTLVQGLLEYVEAKKHGQSNLAVIPIMNIPEKEFRIKTEVVYSLRSHNIPLNLITFRDQINLQNVQSDIDKKLELILVDHHTLASEDVTLKPSVVAIIDHRPLDPNWLWPNISLNIETVGSCATLVARNVLQKCPNILDIQILSFLRGPILIDTYNMSNEAGRATIIDIDVLDVLEQLGGLLSDRTETFNKIMNAKTDISELTLEELMIKDLKITDGIPLVGFSILVQNFLMRENAKETIEKFGNDRNCPIIVLIGQDVSSEHVSRDIAIFSTISNQLAKDIIQALTSSTQPCLNLEMIKEIRGEIYNLYLYRQGNVKVTRKQILPIVQKTVLLHRKQANINK